MTFQEQWSPCKKCVFGCFLNSADGSAAARIIRQCVPRGVTGVWERTFNYGTFVLSRDSVKSVDDVDRSPERVRPTPTNSTVFVRYAGHVP